MVNEVYEKNLIHPSVFEKIKLGHVERLSPIIVAMGRNTIGNLKIIDSSKLASSILSELMIHIIAERRRRWMLLTVSRRFVYN